MAIDVAVLRARLVADTKQYQTAMAGAQATGTKFGTVMKGAAKTGALALAAAGVASVKLASDFDKSMRNVNSIAQLSEKQFKSLEKQVLRLAGKTAQSPQTLSEGLYDLVSSGFDAKESMEILASSAKGATAGLTDTATSTKAVAAVLNAYRKPAKEAKDVTDVLFKTVDQGVITFEELASQIGDVLPFSSQLGVKLHEVGAAVATMTKQGISAPETMTRIKNTMIALLKPSEGMKQAFDELGVSSGEALLKQKGYLGALQALVGTTSGANAEVAKLFIEQRALGGVLALTGKNAKAASKDLEELKDSSGATNRALKEQSKSLAFQMQKLSAHLQAIAIKLGNLVIPALAKATGFVTQFIEALEGSKKAPRWLQAVAAAAKTMFNAFKLAAKTILFGLPGAILQVRDSFKILVNFLKGPLSDAWASIKDAARDAIRGALGAVSSMLDAFGKVPNQIPIFGGIADGASEAAREINELRNSLKNAGDSLGNVDKHKDKVRNIGKSFERTRTEIAQTTKDIKKNTEDDFRKTAEAGDKHSKSLRKNVTRNVGNMVGASLNAISHYGGETNKALKSLGVKKQIYQVAASKGNYGGFGGSTTGGNQRGGPIRAQKGMQIPGSGSGDRVPVSVGGVPAAMVEPGEGLYVVNRNAQRMLEKVNGAVPRFQAGGGLKPGISRLVKWAGSNLGLRVSSGLRPGDAGSYHGSGEAVDFVPPSMKATVRIFNAFKNQLAELFYDPWGGWDSGQRIGAIGGHMDHIHAAILGSGSGAAAGMAKMLKRLVLKGPKGPMRDAGQAGMDMVREGANALIRKHSAATGAMHGNVSMQGPLQAIARRLVSQRWGMKQWPPFSELVQRESGWDPTAENPSSGAAGLAQALPPSKYPPGAWPYRGKSSAVKQLQWMVGYIGGRYGTPSSALSFHDSHNYYKSGGPILQRLQKGGGMKAIKGTAFKTLPDATVSSIGSMEQLWQVAEDYAGRASSTGNVQLETYWTQTLLARLVAMRNMLLSALEALQPITKRLERVKKRAKNPATRREASRLLEQYSEFRSDWTDTLGTVHGSGSPMGQMSLGAVSRSPLETLGGEILSARIRLRELRAPESTSGSESESQSQVAALLREQLLETRRALAVSQAQYGVFAGLPSFDGGGVVPGPKGAPVPIMAHGGEVVGSEGASITVVVNGDITNVPQGRDPVQVLLGDEHFKREIADYTLRRGSRRG